jgi:hypothetical protein
MESQSKSSLSSIKDQDYTTCTACAEKEKKYNLLQEQYIIFEKKYPALKEKLPEFQTRCEQLEYQISQLTSHRFCQKSEKRPTVKKSSPTVAEPSNKLNGRKPLSHDYSKKR